MAVRREPLTTNQHILHLLVTIFTFGLWAPVWICLAIAGNKADTAELERQRLRWWYSLTPEQQAIERRAWNETHPGQQIQ